MRVTLLVLALLLPLPAAAADGGQRVYLMADHGDYLYWTPDANDPELPVERVVRRCGQYPYEGLPDDGPCRFYGEGGRYHYFLDFAQDAVLNHPVIWDAENPLRFHVELDIDGVGDTTHEVQIGVGRNDGYFEGGTSEQVAPGVWEGELTVDGALSPILYHHLYVRVSTPANPATITIATGGASWIELPGPAATTGVPDLLAADTGAVEPTSYVTPERSFAFNDRDWTAYEFSGEGTASFPVDLDRPATAVIGWAEAFPTATIHDLAHGGSADPTAPTANVDVKLLRGGEEVAHGGRAGQGYGGDVASAPGIAAGPLTLEVQASGGRSFTAHLLVIHGERTLARLRYRFGNSAAVARLGGYTVVGGSVQSFPTTAAVQTFALTVSWDSVSPVAGAWIPGFSIPGGASFASGTGNGPRVRLTYPTAAVWYVNAALPYDRVGASYRDTVFELAAEFTYTPRPPD